MSEHLALMLFRFKWRVLLLLTLLVMGGGYGMKNLTFTTDYQAFFSEENPQLMAYEAIENTYTHSDNVLIVIAPQSADVFNTEVLAVVKRLTEAAWQVPYSIRVDSISNFQHTQVSGDDLLVADLVTSDRDLNLEELASIKSIALQEPDLVHKLISPSGHVTGINITVQFPGVHLAEGKEVGDYVRSLVASVEAEHPDIEFYLSGLVMLNNAYSDAAQTDMKTLIPLMYLTVLVLLAVFLRTLVGVLITLVIIVMSVIIAMGITGWIGWQLSPPAVSAPTIILTIAVANCVHLLVAFNASISRGITKQAAMVESLTLNLYPIFITGITTIMGFLTLNFSEVPPYRVLGNIVALGVAAAMLLSITLLPILMAALPQRHTAKSSATLSNSVPSGAMDGLANFVIRFKAVLLVVMGIATVFLVSMLPNNKLEDKFVESFHEDMPFRKASDFTGKNLTGVYTIEYSVVQGEEGGISEPAFLEQLETFSDWLKTLPEVVHVSSVGDTFKRLNQNMHGDDPAWYRIPETRELAAQYLLLYEMSLPFGLDLNHQINMDKSATRVVVTFQDLSTEEMLAMEQRIANWWEQQADIPIGASATLMFSHISQRNIRSLLLGAGLALVLISFTLILALRSWKYGLISLIPNIIPAAMAFGIWGLFVGKVGMGLSVVVGMTLGVIVDDTVHFLTKYIRARRIKKLDSEAAVRDAFSTVGRALWITSVVLVVGFSLLAFSQYNRNADMGLMTAITIALALAIDFLMLPALLLVFDRSSVDRATVDRSKGAQPLNTPLLGIKPSK